MKLFGAFFRLVRWPNLVFIAITQLLFVFCITHPIFQKAERTPNVAGVNLILLCIASILIAAAGYIINDYFDLNIDKINKPDKLVVEKIINRRWTIIWHLALSFLGIAISFYLDVTSGIAFLGIANTIAVFLLFIYSVSLKKKLLAGNILISLLTAWTVLVVMWCETNHLVSERGAAYTTRLSRYTFLYAGFAFVISLIREAVKDMEDIEGDRRYGCTTMPIVWGINASKVYVSVWLIVLIGVLSVIQFYVLQFGWWWSAAYSVVFIIAPLVWIFFKLVAAQSQQEFHRLSTAIKFVMFTGILSMLLIRLYN